MHKQGNTAILGVTGGTPCRRSAWVFRPPAPMGAASGRQSRGERAVHTLRCQASSKGVLILPGFLSGSRQYEGLAAVLSAKGYAAEIVPLTVREDWLPVLSGGNFKFYLDKICTALQGLHAQHGPVALVGHSAGGWVARILLGDEPYEGVVYGPKGREQVHTLITLGSPHQSMEQYPLGRAEEHLSGPNLEGAPPAVRGSSLKFTNWFYPTAASHPGVRVVCFAGNAIRGRPLFGGRKRGQGQGESGGRSRGAAVLSSDDYYLGSVAGSMGSMNGGDMGYQELPQVLQRGRNGTLLAPAPQPPGWLDAWFAYESYKSGCGQGEVDGDGVTPIAIAHLPGAENFVVPGVWHTPRQKEGQLWYGDRAVVEKCWEQYLKPL